MGRVLWAYRGGRFLSPSAQQLMTEPTDDEVLFIIDGHPVMAKGLTELGKLLGDVDDVTVVSHGMRRLIERKFPQYLHKLPPKWHI